MTRAFPGAAQQRCQVHYLRNLLAQCSSVERFAEVKARLNDAWESPTREIADQKLKALLDELEEKQPRLAHWLEESIEETLAVFELPSPTERKKLRTTNGLERQH